MPEAHELMSWAYRDATGKRWRCAHRHCALSPEDGRARRETLPRKACEAAGLPYPSAPSAAPVRPAEEPRRPEDGPTPEPDTAHDLPPTFDLPDPPKAVFVEPSPSEPSAAPSVTDTPSNVVELPHTPDPANDNAAPRGWDPTVCMLAANAYSMVVVAGVRAKTQQEVTPVSPAMTKAFGDALKVMLDKRFPEAMGGADDIVVLLTVGLAIGGAKIAEAQKLAAAKPKAQPTQQFVEAA